MSKINQTRRRETIPVCLLSIIGIIFATPILGADYPIIFIHGQQAKNLLPPYESRAIAEEAWKCWYIEGRNQTALEKILAENYGGYTAGKPLNCSRETQSLESTGGETRKIYNFSYYAEGTAEPGAIGSNGELLPVDNDLRYEYVQNVNLCSYARELSEFIDMVLEATGASKVNIVAHCMGGLVARSAIKFYGCADKVNKIVLIATPTRGTHYHADFWIGIVTNFEKWQENGELLELNVDVDALGDVMFMETDNPLHQGTWCDLVGDGTLGVETATIAGDRNPYPPQILPNPADGLIHVDWVKVDGASFNAVVYAEHSFCGSGIFPPQCEPDPIYALTTCPFTEWFIKKWVIDGKSYVNPQIYGDPAPYPSTWAHYENRLNLRLSSPALVAIISMRTSDNKIVFRKGIPAFFTSPEFVDHDDPVWALSPRNFPNGSYVVEIEELYDMNGRTFTFPTVDVIEVYKFANDIWDPEILMMYPQGGEYHYKPNIIVRWKMRANQVRDFNVYLSRDGGISWDFWNYKQGLFFREDSLQELSGALPEMATAHAKIKVWGNLDPLTKLTGESGEFTVNTLCAPTNLQAQPLSSTEFKLTWEDNSHIEDGYEIWMRTSEVGWGEIEKAPGDDIVGTDEFIISESLNPGYHIYPGTTYWFKVCSYVGEAPAEEFESPYSNIASATTYPALEPPVITSCQPLPSSEIYLAWEHPFDGNPTKGFIILETREDGQERKITIPPEDNLLRDTIIENLLPSTRYTYQIIAYDGQVDHNESPPSNEASATTHPYLSARVDYSLDPSNSSKFTEKGDKVYLVHEDQDKVWLITGKKDPGKGIAWDEREYLLSDLLPQAWDPCIGLLETTAPWDTMLFCAFAGRDGVYERDKIYAVWLDPDDLPNAIIAPQAIYEADPDVNLFNLDVALNYSNSAPTAHLVWEEHELQGANLLGQVRYGTCDLSSLSMIQEEDVDGSWTAPASSLPVPYSWPDVELKGTELWVAALHNSFGLVVWKRISGAWAKVYVPPQGFSTWMADYPGFDLGIAPPASPYWPFLAFAYGPEKTLYFASPFAGIKWELVDMGGIVDGGGVENPSEPAVAWFKDTAFVAWKETDPWGRTASLEGRSP